MKTIKIGVAIVGIMCACMLAAVSCASMARPLEARIHAKLMPADKQTAQTEIALDQAQVTKLLAQIEQGEALIAADSRMDNKYTQRVLSEWKANVNWYGERIGQIQAILPTLPDAPQKPQSEATPPAK